MLSPAILGASSAAERAAYRRASWTGGVAPYFAEAGTAGACGDICDSFCAVGQAVCPGQTNECATMLCTTYSPAPTSYSTALTTGNNIGCRLYKLTLAAENGTAAATHCSDVGVSSASCIP